MPLANLRLLAALVATLSLLAAARADPYLADFPYPFAVARFDFRSQYQDLWMSYMDIAAARPNGRTVVLLHGKNFCGATWEGVIPELSDAGYRIMVPDQVGFCRSAKPRAYQFSLHQLAANTHALLSKLGVEHPIILGHAMGGMLAIRYALMYPAETGALVLVNPIGLEDWKAKGVPLATIDELYAKERKTTAESIKRYQQAIYYHGEWRPEYDRWVAMLASMYTGKDGDLVAWNQALTSDMAQSQPVIYEVDQIKVPTLLLIYAALAPAVTARIKGASLVTFEELGNAPQIEDRDRFNAALLKSLDILLPPSKP